MQTVSRPHLIKGYKQMGKKSSTKEAFCAESLLRFKIRNFQKPENVIFGNGLKSKMLFFHSLLHE